MRVTSLLLASPLLVFLALPAAGGCGSTVVGGNGGSGNAGNGGTGNGSGEGFDDCTGPGQCTLATPGCCETCGPIELSGKVAINVSEADGFFASVCPEPEPCPKCATSLNPNLFAYCDSGHCKGADTRVDPVGACKVDSDCRLRFGTGCCEPCGGDTIGLTAVNNTFTLDTLVCGPDIGCPACAPIYPPNATATCIDGQCAVVLAL